MEIGLAWELEYERDCRIADGSGKKLEQVRRTMLLKSIGHISAWLLEMELYGWCKLRNRSYRRIENLANTKAEQSDRSIRTVRVHFIEAGGG
ncbi:MAG: hypothetical protein NV67_04415 [Gammaproteobacteria bacterium (ex Lamellibrachia satsuma)]|nr:MAG: hypothetical protein NV67_04415 [Gammaproteobacteria bacterium (ex Lamellibrachia satsuma)]